MLHQVICVRGKTWCVETLASSALKSLCSKDVVSLVYKIQAINTVKIFKEFL